MKALTKNIISLYFVLLGTFLLGAPTVFAVPSIEFQHSCDQVACTSVPQNNEYHIYPSEVLEGQEVTLDIVIKNPDSKPIYSVSSWLKYDPDIFKVTVLDGANSDFSLPAPKEFEVDEVLGEIKIGRASPGVPVTKTHISVATVTLKALKNTSGSKLSFIDYRSSDTGKTAILEVDQNFITQNILSEKPKDLIFTVPANGVLGSGTSYNSSSSVKNSSSTVNNGKSQNNQLGSTNNGIKILNNGNVYIPEYIDIPRPQGFRTRTYADGRVDLLWKIGEDSRIKGYYIYYSDNSGKYMHRVKTGWTNNYRFPADKFEKGKRMYFAIQAYDINGKTSDFSDETYVVVGIEGSESHPFFEQIFSQQSENIINNHTASTTESDTNSSSSVTPHSNMNSNKNSNITDYPSPTQNTQTGFNQYILFLVLGGIFLFLGARKWIIKTD